MLWRVGLLVFHKSKCRNPQCIMAHNCKCQHQATLSSLHFEDSDIQVLQVHPGMETRLSTVLSTAQSLPSTDQKGFTFSESYEDSIPVLSC